MTNSIRTARLRRGHVAGSASLMALALAMQPGVARAQELADPAGESAIVVTASRIATTGEDAPTPTTVVGGDDIELRAATNIADVLNTVPSFGQGKTPTSTNHTSLTSGFNIVNLRGLGVERTLVLVDGKRFVPSEIQGRIDLNQIPTVLIERAEVVTGGASAAWGSDAVAGVVNLIFKKKMTGLTAEGQYGISDYGDNQRLRGALGYGFNFADDRGNVMIAGEWEDNKGIGPLSSRQELKDENWYVVQNPGYVLGNGQPRSYLSNDVNISRATLGGLITSGPLQGTQFLQDGTPAAFTYGDYVGSQYMVGGSPIGDVNQTELGMIEVPVKRHNIYGRASFEVSDALELYAEASYAKMRSEFDLSIRYDLGTMTIQRDNAFLPESVGLAMDAAGVSSFSFGRINRDLGYNHPININETQRYMFGGQGNIGAWKWSAYFQFGQSRYQEFVENNRYRPNWNRAIDAVVDPSSGAVVCRSTLTDPDNGCIPYNVFGEFNRDPAAVDYVSGTSWFDIVLKEQSAAADFSGPLFMNWAGEVSLATGVEWRKDSVVETVDPRSEESGWDIHNPHALEGEVTVKEIYGELLFPLLADAPMVQQLDLNAAVRYTDYSSSGGVTSWKVGLSWEVNDAIRLRATRSHDIRAATLGELYASSLVQSATIIDPVLNNQQYATLAPRSGNPTLSPETGDTWTVGAIFKPVRGLTASIDYFDITIEDSIGLPSVSAILDGCYVLNVAEYCSLITRGGGGYAGSGNVISEIRRTYVNQGTFKTNGIDFEVGYTTWLDDILPSVGGTLSARVLATWVDNLSQELDGILDTRAGVVGTGKDGVPHWRWNASLTWQKDPLTVFVEGRYVGGGVYDDDVDEAGELLIARVDGSNDLPSQFILNTTVRYKVAEFTSGGEAEIFGSVRNMFDDIATGNPLGYILSATSNAGLYDIVGRQYTAGFRVKF